MSLSRTLFLVAITGLACASERYFGYSQASNVLAPGQREIEGSATWRAGRQDYYRRLDTRLELEAGLAENLQGAFYLNFKQVTQYDKDANGGQGGNTTSSDLDGVSLELKRRFSDSATEVVGSALYTELTLNTEETEFEVKGIVDKQLAAADLVALNVFIEPEWDNADNAHPALPFGASAGWSHRLNANWAVGLEAWGEIEYGYDDDRAGYTYEKGAVYGGPNAHYANQGFWANLTVSPQLFALKKSEFADGSEQSGRIDLIGYERLQVRLLVGYDF